MILKTIQEYDAYIMKLASRSIGFVPTMGALHDGHLSLIQESTKHCEVTVVSIFVNPTQFNNSTDLENYPRTLDEDYEIIKNHFDGVVVFAPAVNEIYPFGIKSKTFDFGELSTTMEGKHRKGHFDGVGTVLERLFKIIRPTKAFFGEKDFQQLMVVKKLVELLKIDIEIIGCQIYREDNGLAKSSRNKLLSYEDKQNASLIFEMLTYVKNNFSNYTITELIKHVSTTFENSNTLDLEYFEIANDEDLIPTTVKHNHKRYRGFIAAYCNGVRLIDNMALN